MDTRKVEIDTIETGSTQNDEPLPKPVCPFCATSLSLSRDESAQAEYKCEQSECAFGYSRSIFKGAETIAGRESAYHPQKEALVQVVDFGGCCSVYTRRSGDEEGRSRIPIGYKLSLKDVFDDIDRWLPS